MSFGWIVSVDALENKNKIVIPFFIILMELFNIVVESVGSNDTLIIGTHGGCDLILAINNKLVT